jgi:hypothetical protein
MRPSRFPPWREQRGGFCISQEVEVLERGREGVYIPAGVECEKLGGGRQAGFFVSWDLVPSRRRALLCPVVRLDFCVDGLERVKGEGEGERVELEWDQGWRVALLLER